MKLAEYNVIFQFSPIVCLITPYIDVLVSAEQRVTFSAFTYNLLKTQFRTIQMKLAEYKVTYIYSLFNNTRNLFVSFIRIQGNHFGKLEVQKNCQKKTFRVCSVYLATILYHFFIQFFDTLLNTYLKIKQSNKKIWAKILPKILINHCYNIWSGSPK